MARKDNPFGVGPFLHGLARLLLRLGGWRIEGSIPEPPRAVLVAAPHTSNWDGFWLVVAAYAFHIRISWFVKDSVFFFPLGPIVRYFGGVAIDRTRRRNMVAQAVSEFARRENFLLVIPPEATRSRAAKWKTGFYHIAQGAGVPIVLSYLDYGRKVAGMGPAFRPTGDIVADVKVFAEFYAPMTARYPELVGPIEIDPKALSPAAEKNSGEAA